MTTRFRKIDPEHYFSGWQFEIRSALWPALGVTQREYVDRPKTKAARQRAMAAGKTRKEAARIKITYTAYVVADSPQYTFEDGDIFYRRGAHGENGIQIGPVRDQVEVLTFEPPQYTALYQMSARAVAEMLRTGINTASAPLPRTESYRYLTRYLLRST